MRVYCGAVPLDRGRPLRRPVELREGPDQGVRRGRGRPPHFEFVCSCNVLWFLA
jgi:hypothetical protein